jgi:hypothetical protein
VVRVEYREEVMITALVVIAWLSIGVVVAIVFGNLCRVGRGK